MSFLYKKQEGDSMTTTKKEDRRVKFTKLFLKNSLIDLLETKDIAKITIKEICEHADINRATFYAHYGDQYALLKSIEDDYVENILKDFSQHKKNMSDTLVLTERILTYIYNNAKMSQLLLSDRGDIHFLKRIVGMVHDIFLAEFSKASPDGAELADYISSYVLSGCIGVIQKWFENGLVKTPQEIAKIISTLALNTLETLEH